jgi:hypothetical protein
VKSNSLWYDIPSLSQNTWVVVRKIIINCYSLFSWHNHFLSFSYSYVNYLIIKGRLHDGTKLGSQSFKMRDLFMITHQQRELKQFERLIKTADIAQTTCLHAQTQQHSGLPPNLPQGWAHGLFTSRHFDPSKSSSSYHSFQTVLLWNTVKSVIFYLLSNLACHSFMMQAEIIAHSHSGHSHSVSIILLCGPNSSGKLDESQVMSIKLVGYENGEKTRV